jgi:hypothetical protein
MSSATRPEQHEVSALLCDLPAAVEACASLAGPLIVLFGGAIAPVARRAPAAKAIGG